MASMNKHHQEMIDGEGKCSVPMWCNGLPAGFCDAPAYGKQEQRQRRYGNWERGYWRPAYAPALACYNHGGPKAKEASNAN